MSSYSAAPVQSNMFGTFDHNLGLVTHTSSEETRAVLDDRGEFLRLGSVEQRRILLELSSQVHEQRHYLDSFGTIAGITAFQAWNDCLESFMEVSLNVRITTGWQLPLQDWLAKGCSPDVRRLAYEIDLFRESERYFFGRLPRAFLRRDTKDVWFNADIVKPKNGVRVTMPGYVMSFGKKNGRTGAVSENPDLKVYIPVGYEVVAEGTAQALTRDIVHTLHPEYASDFMVFKDERRLVPGDRQAARKFLESVPNYDVTDLMLTKYLRQQGTHSFARNTLLQLSDIAMAGVRFPADGLGRLDPENPLRFVGDVFIRHMTGTGVKDLVGGKWPYPRQYHETYSDLLSNLRCNRTPAPEHVSRRDNPRDAPAIWRSFIEQHVTIPLLENRFATFHRTYTDTKYFLAEFQKKNWPLVESHKGHLNFHLIPEHVRKAWSRQMMLGSLVSQYFSNAEILHCPRRKGGPIPGIEHHEMCATGCEQSRKKGCGSWDPQDGPENLPDCLFRECLMTYGFIPIKKL